MIELGFDGRVALITGAGGGLGREHAMALARRGCHVVVNDIGGAVDGTESGADPAQAVVDEIVAAGGEAVVDRHSVSTPDGGASRTCSCRRAASTESRPTSSPQSPEPA